MKSGILLLLVIVLTGCSNSTDGPEMRTVSGRITINGTPLTQGEIQFRPTDSGASSAGQINNGNYSFRSTLGTMRVEIRSLQIVEGEQGAVGGIEGEPVGPENPAPVYKEVVPEKYHAKSELTVEVTRDGKNQFDFELKD